MSRAELSGRCFGRFFIKIEDIFKRETLVRELMKDVLVLDARWSAAMQSVEYVGLSKEDFTEVPESQEARGYRVEVVTKQIGNESRVTGFRFVPCE